MTSYASWDYIELTGGGTVTADAPALSITQTWNSSGVSFKGVKINITNTASASTSRMLDVQVGGNSKFSVATNGDTTTAGGGSFAGDVSISATGSTTGSPRLFGMTGFSSNEAARWYFGDVNTVVQNAWGSRMQIYAWHGIEIRGARSGANPGFVGGGGSGDASLYVFDGAGSAPILALVDTSGVNPVQLYREAANTLAQRNSTTAQVVRIYNTFTSSTNYERAAFDWSATSNVFLLGPEANTGTVRAMRFQGANFQLNNADTGIFRGAAGVVEFNNGTAGTLTGTYMKWGGTARVSSQFDKSGDTNLANVTGLSVNVSASRVYAFRAILYCSCAAAGGAKVSIAGTATATATRFHVQTYTSTTLNVSAQVTTLGTAGGASTTAVDRITIDGYINVNAAGTLTVQFAQNVASGTSSVLIGSHFIVHDVN